MKKNVLLRALCILSVWIGAQTAWALDANHFASSSKLAQGHWVKIKITQNGVYQIDKQQLAEMGFSDLSKVQVFGFGGQVMSDVLSNQLPDDLHQVPVLRLNDKICFYGQGPVKMSLKLSNGMPAYSRQRNTYTMHGCYFITENCDALNVPMTLGVFCDTASTQVSTSYDCLLHESEETSLSFTGAELLGENITQGRRTFAFELDNLVADSAYLTTRIAANIVRLSASDTSSDIKGRFSCFLTANGETIEVPYDATTGLVPGATRDYTLYESGESTVKTVMPANNGSLRYSIVETTGKGLVQVAQLDYFIFTYLRSNTLNGVGAQCPMGIIASTAKDKVVIDAPATTRVWDITDVNNLVDMSVEHSDGQVAFTPGLQMVPRQYLAFDPASTLLTIDGFEEVENQNLHAMQVPDLLIITNSTLMPQAERVADLHRQYDGMDVAVVDHEKIFNEFSSGTPNAMAYRLLCKMFHDRDKSKFKNLLLFGPSSFDNRGLVTGKKNCLMCYETALSNYDDLSRVIEDYFGFLGDNSGYSLAADTLCIGVGRIPSSSLEEAKSDVDKLYEYVLSPDYGVWRNQFTMWAEKSTTNEKLLHEKQAEGIVYIMDKDLDARMMVDKAYVGMFPKNVAESNLEEVKRSVPEGKKHIQEMLSAGQYFASYIGHARATSFTNCGMWMATDVRSNSYANWPIMTTACCDVARFDSDHQGIAELMFHKRDGGAIALCTTSRQVYSTGNDRINRAFVTAMFSYKANKAMPATLGEVYMKTKRCYGSVANSNKLSFLLLGDPALKINYPKPLFKITKIKTTDMTGSNTVTVRPLERVEIEATVMDENDTTQVNSQFNGDATISLYDMKRTYLSVQGTGDYEEETHTAYYPQELLARVTGRVTNGIFTGSVVVPRYVRSRGNNCTLSVYAHQDGTDQMVNGITNNVIISAYNGTEVVTDNQAPVIESMFLNEQEEFATNANVGSDVVLYIHATDDNAFNLQQQSLGTGMTLKLDGGKTSYTLVKNHAEVSDEGRALDIAFPMGGLTPGSHTLEFTVTDVCGNRTSHTVAFVVSGCNDLTLSTNEPSGWESVEIDLSDYVTSQVPTMNLKVTNLKGELVWSTSTANFPCTWDLTDLNGNRVQPGLYKIHGNYENEEAYGGTNMLNFVVLNPLN